MQDSTEQKGVMCIKVQRTGIYWTAQCCVVLSAVVCSVEYSRVVSSERSLSVDRRIEIGDLRVVSLQ